MTDPYAAPQSDVEISEGIIDALRGTRGWVLFIAILMVLGAVTMVCGGGFMALGGVAGVAAGEPGEATMVLGMALFYGLFSFFYALPAWWLFRYFRTIGDAVVYQDTASVEKALLAQRTFWRGIGILIILFLLLYVVIVGVVVLAGVVMSL